MWQQDVESNCSVYLLGERGSHFEAPVSFRQGVADASAWRRVRRGLGLKHAQTIGINGLKALFRLVHV